MPGLKLSFFPRWVCCFVASLPFNDCLFPEEIQELCKYMLGNVSVWDNAFMNTNRSVMNK